VVVQHWRIILTDIPACVIQTDSEASDQDRNKHGDSQQVLKQRLSCIPIHIDTTIILQRSTELVLDAENTSDSLLIVTSGDFKIRNFETGKILHGRADEADIPQ
jgi:Ni2+-binding GTPase involved in maturation of urease and hydrogenase